MLNLLFPPKCVICGKIGEDICNKCFLELEKYKIKKQYKDIFFIYKYEDIIRKLILDYKFHDKSYLYKTFSEIILKNKKLCKILKSYDIITSVPLHKKRLRQRGYNQSDLIAKEVAKGINRKYKNDIIIKVKNTKPQSLKNVTKRINDVIGIYKINNTATIKEKSIAIFDDVYTTGSTLNECKKVLLEAGAKKVGLIALAKDYKK